MPSSGPCVTALRHPVYDMPLTALYVFVPVEKSQRYCTLNVLAKITSISISNGEEVEMYHTALTCINVLQDPLFDGINLTFYLVQHKVKCSRWNMKWVPSESRSCSTSMQVRTVWNSSTSHQ